jgi:hypothetical protein
MKSSLDALVIWSLWLWQRKRKLATSTAWRASTTTTPPLLFQFARHERDFHEAAMNRSAEAASEPKLVRCTMRGTT